MKPATSYKDKLPTCDYFTLIVPNGKAQKNGYGALVQPRN